MMEKKNENVLKNSQSYKFILHLVVKLLEFFINLLKVQKGIEKLFSKNINFKLLYRMKQNFGKF